MLTVRSKGVTSMLIEFNDRTSVSCAGSRFRLDFADDKDAYANCLVIFLVLHTWEHHVFLFDFFHDAYNLE